MKPASAREQSEETIVSDQLHIGLLYTHIYIHLYLCISSYTVVQRQDKPRSDHSHTTQVQSLIKDVVHHLNKKRNILDNDNIKHRKEHATLLKDIFSQLRPCRVSIYLIYLRKDSRCISSHPILILIPSPNPTPTPTPHPHRHPNPHPNPNLQADPSNALRSKPPAPPTP